MTLTVMGQSGPQRSAGRVRRAPSARHYQTSIVRSTLAGQPLAEGDLRRPGQLRRMNCALLTHWGLQPCIEVADLVLTELATNAFQHGAGDSVTITWCANEGRLMIQVKDSSSVRPVVRDVDEASEHGRGLCIVEALADEWGISEDGTTVQCALALPECAA
ncbi:ATP-binding protein [Streptomyces globisporus]|uniref:ATP-binding protein n=1 Tax=Streptomyces globisporus TaxID=1908 RepID=UPI00365A0E43